MKAWFDIYGIIMRELIDHYFLEMKGKENKSFHLTAEQNNWMNDNWKSVIQKWSRTHVNTSYPRRNFFKHYKLRMKLIKPPESII